MSGESTRRMTCRRPDGSYALAEGRGEREALARLGAFEDVYDALCAELASVEERMSALRCAQRNRSVAFKQLLANRLALRTLIGRFEAAQGD